MAAGRNMHADGEEHGQEQPDDGDGNQHDGDKQQGGEQGDPGGEQGDPGGGSVLPSGAVIEANDANGVSDPEQGDDVSSEQPSDTDQDVAVNVGGSVHQADADNERRGQSSRAADQHTSSMDHGARTQRRSLALKRPVSDSIEGEDRFAQRVRSSSVDDTVHSARAASQTVIPDASRLIPDSSNDQGADDGDRDEDMGSSEASDSDEDYEDDDDQSGSSSRSEQAAQSDTDDMIPDDDDLIPESEEADHRTEEELDELLGVTDSPSGLDGAFLDGFSRRFKSWDAFHSALADFCNNSYQLFPIRTTTSVSSRNKKAKHPFPEKYDWYCKTLMCTHGIKQQRRGQGSRTHRFVRFTSCTAKVNATLTRGEDDSYYVFVKASGRHNHNVSKLLHEYYAENRSIRDPDLLKTVAEMRASGSHAKGILAFLRKKTGKKCKLRDVHNILARQRAQQQAVPDEERVENLLREFCDADGNDAVIFVDSLSKVARVVAFQSSQMKRLFRSFPEVVMVDSTHGTNINGYKLFSFVVHDIFGHGQFVHHALLDGETKANMRLAIHTFKENNPEWSRIRVIVTDKDYKEKDVFKEEFPQARQLLCQFHVIEYLKKQVNKLVKGTSKEKKLLKAVMMALVNAESSEEYDRQKELVLQLVGGNVEHPLYDYFLRNWDNIQDEWVSFKRGNVPHLGNDTNNRVESKWGKLKHTVKPTHKLDEVISTLIILQEWADDDYVSEFVKVGTRLLPAGDDPELAVLVNFLSQYAYDLTAPEYRFALVADDTYKIERATSSVAVIANTKSGHRHTIQLQTNRCNCLFMQTLILPCRHVYFYRRVSNCGSILPPLHCIEQRWSRLNPVNNLNIGVVQATGVRVRHVESKPLRQLTESERYIQTKALLEKISDAMRLQSTEMYCKMYEQLEAFHSCVVSGEVPRISVNDFPSLSQITVGGTQPSQVSIIGIESDDFENSSSQNLIPDTQFEIPDASTLAAGDNSIEVSSCVTPSYRLASPAKSSRGQRRRKRIADRSAMLKKVQELSFQVRHGKKHRPVTLEDFEILVESKYSYGTMKGIVPELHIPLVSAPGEITVVSHNVGQAPVVVDKLLPLDALNAALQRLNEAQLNRAAVGGDPDNLIVRIANYGYITESQLITLRKLYWVEAEMEQLEDAVSWAIETAETEISYALFNDYAIDSGNDVTAKLQQMCLGNYMVGIETLKGMFFLQSMFTDLGVVNPSYFEFKDLTKQKELAGAYGAFNSDRNRLIGVLNMDNEHHWVGYYYSGIVCKVFDPLQESGRLDLLKSSLATVVEPQIPWHKGDFHYVTLNDCVQTDGSSCGVWCLVVLELLLLGADWNDCLHDFIPQLRLRLLMKCMRSM